METRGMRAGLSVGIALSWLALVHTAAAQPAPANAPTSAPTNAPNAAPLVLDTGVPAEALADGLPAPSADPADFEGFWQPDLNPTPVQAALGTSGALTTIEGTMPPYNADGANLFWHRVLMEQRGTPVANSAAQYLPGLTVNILNLFLGVIDIVQNRDDVVMMFESGSQWRIHLNGKHPKALKPTYAGHSIGHWEGATLVIDVRGFNTKTWLDSIGSPHSADLRFITRVTKIQNGRKLEFLTTFDDPKMYSKPFTVRHTASWRPEMRPIEVEVENLRPENNASLVYED
jgi:hypothetical protein